MTDEQRQETRRSELRRASDLELETASFSFAASARTVGIIAALVSSAVSSCVSWVYHDEASKRLESEVKNMIHCRHARADDDRTTREC